MAKFADVPVGGVFRDNAGFGYWRKLENQDDDAFIDEARSVCLMSESGCDFDTGEELNGFGNHDEVDYPLPADRMLAIRAHVLQHVQEYMRKLLGEEGT